MTDRLRPIAAALAAFALTLFSPQASPARAGTASGAISGRVVEPHAYRRASADGSEQLLLALPGAVGERTVDEVRLGVDRRLARKLVPVRLPAGWRWSGADARMRFAGESAVEPGPLLAAAFEVPTGGRLPDALELELLGDGSSLSKPRLTPGRLEPVRRVDQPSQVVRLPRVLTPGDRIRFQPLDPGFTPGGGTWSIGGVEPLWNGALDLPSYELELPAGFGYGIEQPIRVTYTDAWDQTLVDGVAGDVEIAPSPTPPAAGPAVTGCSPAVLAGEAFCVCGHFPDPAAAGSLTINGRAIAPWLVSSSSSLLELRLPADFPPGPLAIAAPEGSGFEVSGGAHGVLIGVAGEIDSSKLLRGESTVLRLSLSGTDRKLPLRLWNTTPAIVSLEGGEDQTVVTSGGSPNDVRRTVNAVSPGNFDLHYELSLGSCPCAKGPLGGLDAKDGGEPTAGADFGDVKIGYPSQLAWDLGISYLKTGSEEDCQVRGNDCEELLRRAEQAERTARALRAAANRARDDQARNDREADALEREVEADRRQVAVLRRQAADYRDLERAARESLARNERRLREQGAEHWQKDVDFDRAEVARRAAAAARLEREAAALEARIAQKLALADSLRRASTTAEAAAREAERLAAEARAAYEQCEAKRKAACPQLAEGDSTVATTNDGDTPASAPPENERPERDLCGPDVSRTYLAALRRVYRRMQDVPDSEKGSVDGTLFLKRNGWGIDQWPENPISDVCPSGACSRSGNERGQACYGFFGHCVPAHVLNDIMFGFTAGLLDVPESVQDLGGNWAEGHFNLPDAEKKKYGSDLGGYLHAYWNAPDPEVSRACYRVGNDLAEEWADDEPPSGTEIGDRLGGGWRNLLDEILKLYPSIENCLDCPDGTSVSDWSRDWSRAEWSLSNGDSSATEELRHAAGIQR